MHVQRFADENYPDLSVTIFPRVTEKLLFVIEDAARLVKWPSVLNLTRCTATPGGEHNQFQRWIDKFRGVRTYSHISVCSLPTAKVSVLYMKLWCYEFSTFLMEACPAAHLQLPDAA